MSDFLEDVIEQIENEKDGGNLEEINGRMSGYSSEFKKFAKGEPAYPDEPETDENEFDEDEESATEKLKRKSQGRNRSDPFHRSSGFKRFNKEIREQRKRSRAQRPKSVFEDHHPDFERLQNDPNRSIED